MIKGQTFYQAFGLQLIDNQLNLNFFCPVADSMKSAQQVLGSSQISSEKFSENSAPCMFIPPSVPQTNF
jgi:hypothetical protein